jgi:hypothetical protein
MQAECSQDSVEFASLGSGKVTAAFDGGAIIRIVLWRRS